MAVLGVRNQADLFPAWYFERLEKMAEFSMHVTKPSGKVAQIGDNDSGRFFKLSPVFEKTSGGQALDEQFLDHRHLVGGIGAFFDHKVFLLFGEQAHADIAVVRSLIGDFRVSSYRTAENKSAAQLSSESLRLQTAAALAGFKVFENKVQTTIPLPIGFGKDLFSTHAYPDFGVYIFRSPKVFLAIRCGAVGQKGFGGHDHQDQLSIELSIDGVNVIADPGTCVYTADATQRNLFRSAEAHFVPKFQGKSLRGMDADLFLLQTDFRAQVLHLGEKEFLGSHRGYGEPVYRHVKIEADKIVVTDSSPAKETLVQGKRVAFFSPAYGRKISIQERAL
jgi:hypothetical protein